MRLTSSPCVAISTTEGHFGCSVCIHLRFLIWVSWPLLPLLECSECCMPDASISFRHDATLWSDQFHSYNVCTLFLVQDCLSFLAHISSVVILTLIYDSALGHHHAKMERGRNCIVCFQCFVTVQAKAHNCICQSLLDLHLYIWGSLWTYRQDCQSLWYKRSPLDTFGQHP